VVEGIQNYPVLPVRDLIGLEGGLGFLLRTVACNGKSDGDGIPSYLP